MRPSIIGFAFGSTRPTGWIHVREVLPSRDHPHGITNPAEIDDAIATSIKSGFE